MKVRRATPDDLDRATSLLASAGRPAPPHGLPRSNVLVALDDGEVIGVIALEVRGLRGLVWRDAVDASAHEDVRSSLLLTLLSRAHELSLRDLHVVTSAEDADAEVYRAAGFTPISEDAVPTEIRRAVGYAEPPAAGARVLRLDLVSRSV